MGLHKRLAYVYQLEYDKIILSEEKLNNKDDNFENNNNAVDYSIYL